MLFRSPRGSAARGPQWVCGNCTHIHAAWVPVCENCGAFDTLDWKTPTHAEDASLADSAMLPLIIGTRPEPEPPATAQPIPAEQPEIEDAELAHVADSARAAGAG